ncbi:MAG: hypothetical protein M3401_12740, partial [Actinomycetota bacterium]|nr:hypothetical protein [Actinomycetota bacterium]
FTGVPRDNLWLVAIALLAEAAGPLCASEGASELHALLAPFSGRNVVLPTAAFLGPVDMWLGVLARIAGDREEALERLAAARIAARRHRARTSLVRIAVEEATILAQDSDPAARRRAADVLDEADGLCGEIGLCWMHGCLVELRERLREPRADKTSAPAKVAAAGAFGTPAIATLRRAGDVWTITHEQRTLHLTDGRGVRLLALLLERPGVEIHSLDLVATVDGGEPASMNLAKSEYRARIDALGGRDRQCGSHAERARVNVTRAIRSTLKRIAGYDGPLGRILEETVQTGTFCAYRPSSQRPVRWRVQESGARR